MAGHIFNSVGFMGHTALLMKKCNCSFQVSYTETIKHTLQTRLERSNQYQNTETESSHQNTVLKYKEDGVLDNRTMNVQKHNICAPI
jgi:hypothetical protein